MQHPSCGSIEPERAAPRSRWCAVCPGCPRRRQERRPLRARGWRTVPSASWKTPRVPPAAGVPLGLRLSTAAHGRRAGGAPCPRPPGRRRHRHRRRRRPPQPQRCRSPARPRPPAARRPRSQVWRFPWPAQGRPGRRAAPRPPPAPSAAPGCLPAPPARPPARCLRRAPAAHHRRGTPPCAPPAQAPARHLRHIAVSVQHARACAGAAAGRLRRSASTRHAAPARLPPRRCRMQVKPWARHPLQPCTD